MVEYSEEWVKKNDSFLENYFYFRYPQLNNKLLLFNTTGNSIGVSFTDKGQNLGNALLWAKSTLLSKEFEEDFLSFQREYKLDSLLE